MYRKLFRYHRRKINKKSLIIILAVLFVLIMVGGYFGLRQDTRVATIDKIKSYLSNLELRSEFGEEEFEESLIADLSSKMSSIIEGIEEETGELTDDALLLEKTKEVLGEETTAVPKLTLEEIGKQVNEISKKVAIVSIQIQILTLKDISSQIDKEDLGEDTLEDISERINQVSEQIELITLQLQQLL